MQLKTQCPNCQKTFRCPATRVGTFVRCPACKHKFRVTSTASGSASMAAEPSMEVRHTIDSAASRLRDQRSGTQRSGSAQSNSDGSRRRQSIADLPSLGRFGQYDLKAILGSGGFGVVYRAWDTQLGRQVAIKVPRFDVTDQRKVRRFRQEARSAAKLQHPNIVVVLEEGMQSGKPFIVSEYVDGEPLSARIGRGRPDIRVAVQWARDLALALSYAHAQGVVHRDIKPDNIMLGNHGRPQIMDFGLAKQLDDDSSLSIDGSVLGTPSYMPPEQARGEMSKIDGRSDQYSLSVVLYELLTGSKPFSGPIHAVLAKVADPTHEPPSPRTIRSEIPRDLEAICLKGISKRRSSRYDDLSEMAADLDRWLQGKATSVRHIRRSERAWRWCRSNPALATTGTLCAVFATLFVWNIGAVNRLGERTAGAPKSPLGLVPSEVISAPASVLPSRSDSSPGADELSLSSRSGPQQFTAPTTEGGTADPPAAAIAPFDADQAKRHQREWAAYLGVAAERVIELPGGQTLELVLIPPGEFLMGTTAEEELRMRALAVKDPTEYAPYQDLTTDAQEVPSDQRQPTVIDEPFYLGKYEVTNEQWASLTDGQPPLHESDRRTAAGGLSWLEIQEAMKDLNENLVAEGLRAGLPTRAHWEYACRAGTATAWYFGNDDSDFARFGWDVKNSSGRLREVGQLKPNAWGLFDCLGNAWEWCADSPGQQFDTLLSAQDGGATHKYMCGGSIVQTNRRCRPSTGTLLPTDYRDHVRGFRLAVSLIR